MKVEVEQLSSIRVAIVDPGVTATPMIDHAAAGNAKLGQLPGFLIGDAAEVAADGYAACMRGEVDAARRDVGEGGSDRILREGIEVAHDGDLLTHLGREVCREGQCEERGKASRWRTTATCSRTENG